MRCATSRPGSPIRSTADGGARSRPTNATTPRIRSRAARATAPPVSAAIFTDWNAAMVSAALQAAEVFDDDGLREFAVKSLERVLLTCYKPGAGVAHYFDGEARVRGLLADQFAMAAACLDAFDADGQHRLRNDGRGARALCHSHDVG